MKILLKSTKQASLLLDFG